MIQNLKALTVVLVLTLLLFYAAKPICLRFMALQDFERRRNIWLVLAATAFASPSIWIYFAVAFPIILLGARRDPNPAALYILLFYAVPDVIVRIPFIGINYLFEIGHQRFLALLILLPVALNLLINRRDPDLKNIHLVDALIVGFILLQLIVFIPHESITNTIRRSVEMGIDTLAYYVISRLRPSVEMLAELLCAFALGAALLVPVALFEFLKGWLLYVNIAELWGNPNIFAYLFRGDSLRAQASAGHSLLLGYFFAMAFGVCLGLQKSKEPNTKAWSTVNILPCALMCLGLIATISRGPWLTAVVLLLAFTLLGKNSTSTLARLLLGALVIGVLVAFSPWSEEVISFLPFIGTVDADNISYRQKLIDTALILVWKNPIFGNVDVISEMEHLRQGQGIIDLINGYVIVVLYYGFVGLAMYVGIYTLSIKAAYSALRRAKDRSDAVLIQLGASLVACMVATLFFIATAGGGVLTTILAAMLLAYSRVTENRCRIGDLPEAEHTYITRNNFPSVGATR